MFLTFYNLIITNARMKSNLVVSFWNSYIGNPIRDSLLFLGCWSLTPHLYNPFYPPDLVSKNVPYYVVHRDFTVFYSNLFVCSITNST